MSIVIIIIICLLLLIPGSFWLDDVFGMTAYESDIAARPALINRGKVPPPSFRSFSPATLSWIDEGAFGGGGWLS